LVSKASSKRASKDKRKDKIEVIKLSKRQAKNILGFAALGATTSFGGSIAPNAGLGNIASQYPTMGSIMGTGMTMNALGGLIPKKRRRR
jgi:hypothetical protein